MHAVTLVLIPFSFNILTALSPAMPIGTFTTAFFPHEAYFSASFSISFRSLVVTSMLTGPLTILRISFIFASKSLPFSCDANFGLVVQPSAIPQLKTSLISSKLALSINICILTNLQLFNYFCRLVKIMDIIIRFYSFGFDLVYCIKIECDQKSFFAFFPRFYIN